MAKMKIGDERFERLEIWWLTTKSDVGTRLHAPDVRPAIAGELIDALEERLTAAKAIIEKLPCKDAEGNIVVHEIDHVFHAGVDSPLICDPFGDTYIGSDLCTQTHPTEDRRLKVWECYLSREAAEAAKPQSSDLT